MNVYSAFGMSDYPYIPYIPLREEDLHSPSSESEDLLLFQVDDLQSHLGEKQFEGCDVEKISYEYKSASQDEEFDYGSLIEEEEVVPDTPDRVAFQSPFPESIMEFDEELATLTLMFYDIETQEERSARYEVHHKEVTHDILRIYWDFTRCLNTITNAGSFILELDTNLISYIVLHFVMSCFILLYV